MVYMGRAMLEVSTTWMATLNVSWRWPLGRSKSVEKIKIVYESWKKKLCIIYILRGMSHIKTYLSFFVISFNIFSYNKFK